VDEELWVCRVSIRYAAHFILLKATRRVGLVFFRKSVEHTADSYFLLPFFFEQLCFVNVTKFNIYVFVTSYL
jgi:hypothetical protein